MRRTRRKGVPDGVVVRRGERVLAVGGPVVATDAALYLPAAGAGIRLPWECVEQASWRDGSLAVRELGGRRHAVDLADPGSVPEVVRERVTATVVVSTHVRLPGGGVRVVGRRRPGGEGEARWSFVFDRGLDPADAGLAAQAEQALREIRRQTGL